MSILLNAASRVIVQGITGKVGRFHATRMLECGTQIVGGVTPGRGGEWVGSIPVFDSVKVAVDTTGATVSVVFVPRAHAADAVYEAVDAGIKLIVVITEGIPVQDMMRLMTYVKSHGSQLLGPNCPGIYIPGLLSVGIIPTHIGRPGSVGIVSKSGALTFDVVNMLSQHGIGQSSIVGIGADPIVGTSFVEILELFEGDPDTERIVILGEIGGRAEIDAAEYIRSSMTKFVIAFVAGRAAPSDRRMGHAGAIVERGRGTAEEKIEAFRSAGVRVVDNPEEIHRFLL